VPPLDAGSSFDAAGDLVVNPQLDFSGTMADLSTGPKVLLELDARSDSLFQKQAQPFLTDFPQVTLGHFRFDDAAGPAIDQMGVANLSPGGGFTGARKVFTNLPSAATPGFNRTATEFRGDGMAASAGVAFDVAHGDFTVELWLRLPPGYTPRGFGCDPIFSKGSTIGYQVCILPGGKLRMVLNDGMSTRAIDSGSVGFADGAWHLVAFVFSPGTPNASAMFADGKDLAVMPNDLRVPGSLSNAQPFTVGGSGAFEFHGALAELVFHNRALTVAEHAADYRAFALPFADPAAAKDATYSHTGALCPLVGNDSSGDRVACYAGPTAATSAQPAIGFDPAVSDAQNPGKTGLVAMAGAVTNYAFQSESIDKWFNGGSVTVDAALSPRGDLTAETLTIPAANNGAYLPTTLMGNGPATLSVWLRGHNDNDLVYIRVTDEKGQTGLEFNHCLVTLHTTWQRYSCTCSFAKNPSATEIEIDTQMLPGDTHAPLGPVTVDVWGAQYEHAAQPSVYVPDTSTGGTSSSGPVDLSINNAAGSYMLGDSGVLSVEVTGSAALADQTLFVDAIGTGSNDQHSLGRGANQVAEGSLLDASGMAGSTGVIDSAALVWTMTHTLSLSWSATNPISGMVFSRLSVDGAPIDGRTAGYKANAPTTITIGSSGTHAARADGLLHRVTVADRP
jgi:hypothetical protein